MSSLVFWSNTRLIQITRVVLELGNIFHHEIIIIIIIIIKIIKIMVFLTMINYISCVTILQCIKVE